MFTLPHSEIGYSAKLFDVGLGLGHQDSSAVFADDDLLALTDLGLTLGRNPVEAAAAGVALHGYHGQSVADAGAESG